MVSSYEFNQRNSHPQDALWRRMREKKLSLPDYAAEPLARNEQFRILREKPLDEMEFVGITEEYERGVEVFRRVFGLGAIPSAPNLNINPRKHLRDSYILAPNIRRRIESSNSLDLDLYLRAKRRFHELCAKHGV
jgi:hypothetical protein